MSLERLTELVNAWCGPRGANRDAAVGWADAQTGFLASVRACLRELPLQGPAHRILDERDDVDAAVKVQSLQGQLNQLCEELRPDTEVLLMLPLPGPDDVFRRDRRDSWLAEFGTRWQASIDGDEGRQTVSSRRRAVASALMPQEDGSDLDASAARFALLAAAHAFSARAALSLQSWSLGEALTDAFISDVNIAMHCVHAVWPLLTGSLDPDTVGNRDGKTGADDKAPSAMNKLVNSRNDNAIPQTVPTSAWLTVLRLLRTLLNETPAMVERESAMVELQMVDGSQGIRVPLAIHVVQESRNGAFVDLSKSGLVLPDADMLESLNIAWEIGGSRLTRRNTPTSVVRAIELSFQLPETCCRLNGDSAGGMAGISMYAVADRRQLDRKVTGSFTIRRKSNAARIEDLKDMKISSVKGVGLKIISGAERCRHFLLFHQQMNDHRNQTVAAGHGVRLHPLREGDIQKALDLLTTNAGLADVIGPLNHAIVSAWDADPAVTVKGTAAGPTASAAYLRRPSPYVEPHLGQLLPQHEMSDSSEDGEQPRAANDSLEHRVSYESLSDQLLRDSVTPHNEQEVAATEILELMRRSKEHRRIIIAEDANAGKTVFSKRLPAFLAAGHANEEFFDGQPPLVLRWEQGPRKVSEGWPKSTAAIRQSIVDYLAGTGLTDEDAERYMAALMENQRVVLVFDSLDQAGDQRAEEVIAALHNHHELAECWIIVTGRSYSFRTERVKNLFDDDWLCFTILPLTTRQQENYLRKHGLFGKGAVPGPLPESQSIKSVFENYVDIKELLGVVGMLVMVRDILLQQRADNDGHGGEPSERSVKISRLRTRCDFYCEYLHVLEMSAVKAGLSAREKKNRWWLLLSAAAFRMMLGRATRYSTSGNIEKFKSSVESYCNAYLTLAEESRRSGTERPQPISNQDWIEVEQFSVLTNHSIIESSDQESLSFRHKGWLEFFGAMFLSRFADPKLLPAMKPEEIHFRTLTAQQKTQPGFTGVIPKHYTDPATQQVDTENLFDHLMCQLTNAREWYWCWRMAAEMPRYESAESGGAELGNDHTDFRRLGRSLSCLLLQPAWEMRDNELAWRAFYLFEQDDRTERELQPFRHLVPRDVRQTALQKFRKQGHAIRSRIRELNRIWDRAPPPDTEDYDRWLEEWNAQDSETKSLTFLSCPPPVWLENVPHANIHQMGGAGDNDRRSGHWVQVEPFCAQATPVTRGLYRIFDDAFEESRVTASWGGTVSEILEQYAAPRDGDGDLTDSTCPVLMTSWYDAVMLAKFLGSEFGIPSECQHEALIRGGSNGDYCFGSDPDDTLLSQFAWWGENSENRTHPVGLKRPNVFGLYDVHGQVWERSNDWHDEGWFVKRTASEQVAVHPETGEAVFAEDSGPESGNSRVLRGSSFYHLHSRYFARASYRHNDAPDFRGSTYGIRLVCGTGAFRQSSSHTD